MTDVLTIVGKQTRQFTQTELAGRSEVVDLSNLCSHRKGRAVPVSVLLADLIGDATEMVLTSASDGFSARLPLADAAAVGLIWFDGDTGPLTPQEGGPFRFLIPDAAECKTAILDTCANVKFVDRIELH
ncbi:MAG: hypothetical protein AB8G99_21660 [Planctomycetaceae bacterium]